MGPWTAAVVTAAGITAISFALFFGLLHVARRRRLVGAEPVKPERMTRVRDGQTHQWLVRTGRWTCMVFDRRRPGGICGMPVPVESELCPSSHGRHSEPAAILSVDVSRDGGGSVAVATRQADGRTDVAVQHEAPKLSRPVMFDGHPLIDPHAPVVLGGRQLVVDRMVGGMRQVWDPDGQRWLCAVPIPGWDPPGPCGETVSRDQPCSSSHTAPATPPRPASAARAFAADVVRALGRRGLDGR